MDPRRPNLTLRDFFLYEQRMVAEAQINSFFRRLIYTLIVLNVLLGSITYYDRYIHEQTPEILRDVSKILTNEV
jgi:hypothetical protein